MAERNEVRRVGIIFSGGPAPAANAVISAAVVSFLDTGRDVLGFQFGYRFLEEYNSVANRLQLDQHYRQFKVGNVSGIRNTRGVLIGTSRANPGKPISCPADLDDPEKTARLRNVCQAFSDLGVDALISIGGDDTLKTANYLYEYQKRHAADNHRVRIVHLPKTIDNDYEGIDFTFGYFTAADVMAKELLNVRADARAADSYFIIEAMGRKAGWLAYGVGIAGEANMIVSVEDIDDALMMDDVFTHPDTGDVTTSRRLSLDALVDRIVRLMITREEREKKGFGTIVLAEGLAELLPETLIHDVAKDEHGHISIGRLDLGKLVAARVASAYQERTGRKKKVTGIQLGYESRCAPPHAFDVMLGSQLGIGAYKALVEKQLDGHMVSVSGQLDLEYVPFSQLIDAETLKTQVRFIRPGCDFHQLARFLETRTEAG